jgi:hypothetical protein
LITRTAPFAACRRSVRPRTAALDPRAVDALLDDIGLTWLTGDEGTTPVKKGRARSADQSR